MIRGTHDPGSRVVVAQSRRDAGAPSAQMD